MKDNGQGIRDMLMIMGFYDFNFKIFIAVSNFMANSRALEFVKGIMVV